jgi:hypothetical protein
MKKSKFLFILPLVGILASCVVTDYNPFGEDKYVPVGFQTESIVRALSDDEEDIFEDGLSRIDNYVTGVKETLELREYYHSYFGANAPEGVNDIDHSISSSSDIKTYNNDVKFKVQNATQSVLNDYLDYKNSTLLKEWTHLPTSATYETRRLSQVNEDDPEVTINAAGAYVELADYVDLFGYGVANIADDAYADASAVGMNADDEIILLLRDSTYDEMELSRNGFVQVTSSLVDEIKLVLYEPEDSDIPLYLPVQSRIYIEERAISRIYHDGEVLEYLDNPIVIGYQEVIKQWSSEDFGSYDLEAMPDLAE